jgi:hypothetical protein
MVLVYLCTNVHRYIHKINPSPNKAGHAADIATTMLFLSGQPDRDAPIGVNAARYASRMERPLAHHSHEASGVRQGARRVVSLLQVLSTLRLLN